MIQKDLRSGYREEREHGKTRILKYRYNCDARRKYRENQKSLDNMMLLVSSGTIQEVFNGDNEWVFNQVMTETILQQEYIRERERANWGWNRGVVDFSKQGSCIL